MQVYRHSFNESLGHLQHLRSCSETWCVVLGCSCTEASQQFAGTLLAWTELQPSGAPRVCAAETGRAGGVGPFPEPPAASELVRSRLLSGQLLQRTGCQLTRTAPFSGAVGGRLKRVSMSVLCKDRASLPFIFISNGMKGSR